MLRPEKVDGGEGVLAYLPLHLIGNNLKFPVCPSWTGSETYLESLSEGHGSVKSIYIEYPMNVSGPRLWYSSCLELPGEGLGVCLSNRAVARISC